MLKEMRLEKEYKQLIVLIDSSGGRKKDSKNGGGSAFWAAYLYDPFNKEKISKLSLELPSEKRFEIDILLQKSPILPIRCGAVFSDKRGPNNIFYEGLIDVLQSCLYLVKKYSWNLNLIIMGDCKRVFDEIKVNQPAPGSQSFYDTFKGIEREYTNLNSRVEYRWCQREEWKEYQRIDRIAKDFKNKIMNTWKEEEK